MIHSNPKGVRVNIEIDLSTLDEAGKILKTPSATLRYWRHLGVGPPSFRLGRRVMYRNADLAEWVDAQANAATGSRRSA